MLQRILSSALKLMSSEWSLSWNRRTLFLYLLLIYPRIGKTQKIHVNLIIPLGVRAKFNGRILLIASPCGAETSEDEGKREACPANFFRPRRREKSSLHWPPYIVLLLRFSFGVESDSGRRI